VLHLLLPVVEWSGSVEWREGVMDRVTSRLTSTILVIYILVLGSPVHTAKFKCPSFTKLTSDSFVYPDPAQCDKYWTCISGESTRSLCPDGLVFHPGKEAGEDPCDLRHNVPDKCKGRDQLQRAKPGDGHCPRQNGVYASDDPYECDTYYSCLNGKSSPTKCAQGLHYSDDIGTCVWPRESGRDDCITEDSQSGGRKKKPKSTNGPEATTRKPAEALSNGFQCPGGPVGVHPALPHPSDCRLYYICLDGLTPTDAGCTKGKVFNPTTQQCDTPANVEGCEFYYNPAAKKKKEKQDKNIASQLGADVSSDEFNQFLKLLQRTGVLGGKSVNEPFQTGLRSNGLKQGGRVGGGRRKRPKNRRPRPRPRLRRPVRPQYDYYDDYDYYEYDAPRTSSAVNQPFNHQSRIGGSDHEPDFTSAQQDDLKDTVRATPIRTTQQEVSRTPIEQIPLPTSSRALFTVPKSRKNILTSRFIPKVKSVSKPKNIHRNEKPLNVQSTTTKQTVKGPVQPAKAAVVPHLTGKEADDLFNTLFPTLTAESIPVPQPLVTPKVIEVPQTILEEPTTQKSQERALKQSSPFVRPRSRALLFQRKPLKSETTSTIPIIEQTTLQDIESDKIESPNKDKSGELRVTGRHSLFSTHNRLKSRRKNRMFKKVEVTLTTTFSPQPITAETTKAPLPKALMHFRNHPRFPFSTAHAKETETDAKDNVINIDNVEEKHTTTVKTLTNQSPKKNYRSLFTSRAQNRLSASFPSLGSSIPPKPEVFAEPLPESVTQDPLLVLDDREAKTDDNPSSDEPFIQTIHAIVTTNPITKLDHSASKSDIIINSPAQDTARTISRGRGRLKSQEQLVKTNPTGLSERVITSDSSVGSAPMDNIADHVQQRIIAHQVRNQLKDYLPKAENEGDAFEKLRAKVERIQNRNRARG